MNSDHSDYLSVSDEVRSALSTLCNEYVWRLDNGHAASVPALFTDDGVWSGPWGQMAGQAQLKEAWDERATRDCRTRHMLTNMRFSQTGPDRAEGQVGQIVYVANGSDPMPVDATIIAENIDEYLRGSDGVWRIKSRRIAMLAERG